MGCVRRRSPLTEHLFYAKMGLNSHICSEMAGTARRWPAPALSTILLVGGRACDARYPLSAPGVGSGAAGAAGVSLWAPPILAACAALTPRVEPGADGALYCDLSASGAWAAALPAARDLLAAARRAAPTGALGGAGLATGRFPAACAARAAAPGALCALPPGRGGRHAGAPAAHPAARPLPADPARATRATHLHAGRSGGAAPAPGARRVRAGPARRAGAGAGRGSPPGPGPRGPGRCRRPPRARSRRAPRRRARSPPCSTRWAPTWPPRYAPPGGPRSRSR